ncbi:PleD family two-component system response regulator [Paradesertivirga mongoliensis]|uniref:PleD family two-component system response regulator n=1 Tax=Paradesertivirga mongoliensis TaxID=2100740 RepID=A0ABW4ZMX3_9SPHI|nr:response regulator [Pedobacter mongoliensis]
MGRKIVLIQDDMDCQEIMRIILENDGFEVLSPPCKQELFKANPDYDLAIIDEYAVGKTGLQICKQLKEDEETCNIPVVLSSAGTELESAAISCHADRYLVKPFDINYFLKLVNSLPGKNHLPGASAANHH